MSPCLRIGGISCCKKKKREKWISWKTNTLQGMLVYVHAFCITGLDIMLFFKIENWVTEDSGVRGCYLPISINVKLFPRLLFWPYDIICFVNDMKHYSDKKKTYKKNQHGTLWLINALHKPHTKCLYKNISEKHFVVYFFPDFDINVLTGKLLCSEDILPSFPPTHWTDANE